MFNRVNLITIILIVGSLTLLSACGGSSSSYINTAPISNAGSDQIVPPGDSVTLDASASTDAEGNPLTYSWSFIAIPAGSSVTLSDATAIDPSFTPNVDGDYVLALIVNDGLVNSATDYVTITSPYVIDLSGVDLTGTNLTGADLSYANLTGTNLTGADLSYTSLIHADLSYSSLALADLTGADLTGADLAGALLTGVFWSNTICPDGTNSDTNAGSTCRGFGI